MKIRALCSPLSASLVLALSVACPWPVLAQSGTSPQFSISFSNQKSDKPLDGRLLLLLSSDPSTEPRMQINDTLGSQMVFGLTIDGWKPDTPIEIGNNAQGYPRASLKDVPHGDYTIQAVLNVYETFHRSDGTTVKLAPDRG